MKNLSDQHNSHTLVGCLLTPPGEEPDEAPYAAIVRLNGPQAKRAVAGRLPFGDSGGPGKLLPQNRQAGVPPGSFMD